nr:putative integron gene cassette protein [uncultured bacterium]
MSSSVRRRQTKIFSTWGSPDKRDRNSQYPSATYSVQLESSCTPSVDKLSREKLAGAQNQFCAADPALVDWTRVR